MGTGQGTILISCIYVAKRCCNQCQGRELALDMLPDVNEQEVHITAPTLTAASSGAGPRPNTTTSGDEPKAKCTCFRVSISAW